MPDIRIDTIKKAMLIEGGSIEVEKADLPCKPDRSTAGPGAGFDCLHIGFGNSVVRLKIVDNSRFKLKKEDSFNVYFENELFLDRVKIIPTLFHAPKQAFINVEAGCIYNCSFCATPKLDEGIRHERMNPQKAVEAIRGVQDKASCICVTSGVFNSPKITNDLICDVVSELSDNFDLPIGVETYTENEKEIEAIYSSGACEIKINIESADRDIFSKVCPELDYEVVLKSLEHASDIFGKNRVCSNIITGLGEKDENVMDLVFQFASYGVVPTIRPLSINPYCENDIILSTNGKCTRPSAARLINLAYETKLVFEKNNLNPKKFSTMCHRCRSCDLVPFVDL